MDDRVSAFDVADVLSQSVFLDEIASAFADVAMVDSVESFVSAGILTTDAGFVLRFSDGSCFQVTVVPSRW